MKTCPYCGTSVNDDSKFCISCGASLAEVAPDASDVPAPVAAPRASTREEFLQLPENAKMKKEIKSSAIIAYVCAGITLLLSVIVGGSYLSLIDVVILVALGLLIHLKQSKAAAVILLVYSVINVIVTLITAHRLGGYLIVIAGVYATIYAFKLDKAWKEYQAQ